MTHEFQFKTKQGYKVVYRVELQGRLYVIAFNQNNKRYIICCGYDRDSGTWAAGMYDFETLKDAQKILFKNLVEKL